MTIVQLLIYVQILTKLEMFLTARRWWGECKEVYLCAFPISENWKADRCLPGQRTIQSSIQTWGADTTRNGLVDPSGLIVCYHRFGLVSLILHLVSFYILPTVYFLWKTFLRSLYPEVKSQKSHLHALDIDKNIELSVEDSWTVSELFHHPAFLKQTLRISPEPWYPCLGIRLMLDELLHFI